jgi:hypothetical protein
LTTNAGSAIICRVSVAVGDSIGEGNVSAGNVFARVQQAAIFHSPGFYLNLLFDIVRVCVVLST